MAADQERAERIKALKQSRPDLTWRRIADFVGVTERSATDWQSKGGIEYANAEKLAQLFEVDVDFIWRGPANGDRAPSPFDAQDALADRLDAIEQAIADMRREREQGIAEVQALLERQDAVLARIEAAIVRQQAASAQADEATERLMTAVAHANRALSAGTQAPAAPPELRAK